ncbi:MAG TPA: SDR family NAD(P)-dependent oxidoreductase [Candidatus Angelobacter sp.]|jgi:NAD(P)-dependent dehydrogenase (short-subunit alcohol dehydrogenase family)|nr:SDR family NAD(P)-dependent oxidoreductase [Candidatus Angelobacter sp.]
MNLDGKVAVVTGSGRGIGRAYAEALAEAGAAVVINDVDADVAQQTVEDITKNGGRAVAEVVAVGSTEAADRLVNRAVEAFGRLDVMCTNAGILRDRTLWKMSDDDFDAVIETHLRGTFTCGRAAAIRMREQGEGGSLVLVSSIAGQRGNFGQTNYAAAKAGIAAYARTWAMELAKSNITVNAIVPNAITRMIASIPGMGPLVEQAERGEPLPDLIRKGMGMGLPGDVAPLLVFLASDAAREVTGQCIGLGGDKLSLWSHPQEIRMAYRDGGWSADAIAEVWKSSVGQQLESYGIPFLGGN